MSGESVKAQHQALGMTEKKYDPEKHTRHPDAQWFPYAGLGLFIHWGLSSVEGKYDLSWGMIANTPWDASGNGKNKITPDEYWKKSEVFKPRFFEPLRILSAAKAAGCTYAVMTSMHHDGYTMWPSKTGDFGVQTFLPGRDLLGEFIAACRELDLKTGIYYSPPDWYFDRHYMSFNYRSRELGRPYMDSSWRKSDQYPEIPEEHLRRANRIYHERIRELLTNYGKIDLLWLDGGGTDDSIADLAHELQPGIVLNRRSCPGDFDSTECTLPETRFTGWFETPHCWQNLVNNANQWGYFKNAGYKPAHWMLEQLILLRRWGGNLLINVSPDGDGRITDNGFEEMAKSAEWMKQYRNSVIGTLPGEDTAVPMTVSADGKKVFFFFLKDNQNNRVEWHTGGRKITSVREMSGTYPVPAEISAGVLKIDFNYQGSDAMPKVVEVNLL